MADDERRLVYSTDGSLPLPKYERSKVKAPRGGAVWGPPNDGIVRVGCERRRAGSVTLVYGLTAGELETTGGELKRRCGTGGTAKNGILSLQGDRREVVLAYFAERKRPAKRMGG